jgi:hypothetical protein
MGIIFVICPLPWEMVSFYSVFVVLVIVVIARLANIIIITAIYNYEYPKTQISAKDLYAYILFNNFELVSLVFGL